MESRDDASPWLSSGVLALLLGRFIPAGATIFLTILCATALGTWLDHVFPDPSEMRRTQDERRNRPDTGSGGRHIRDAARGPPAGHAPGGPVARAGDAAGAEGPHGGVWLVLDRLLGYVPVAAFAALVTPNLGLSTPEMLPRLLGAAVAAVVVLRRVGHLWAGLGAGMATY